MLAGITTGTALLGLIFAALLVPTWIVAGIEDRREFGGDRADLKAGGERLGMASPVGESHSQVQSNRTGQSAVYP